jgi:hypothetical protein
MNVDDVVRWSDEMLGQLESTKRGVEAIRKSALGSPSVVTTSACETIETQCVALRSAVWTLRYQILHTNPSEKN